MSNYGKELSVSLSLETSEFSKAVKNIAKEATKGFNTIEKQSAEMSDSVEKDFNKLPSKLSRSLKPLGKNFRNSMKELPKSAEDAVDDVNDEFKTLPKKAKKHFDDVGDEAKSAFSNLGNVAKTAMGVVGTAIAGAFAVGAISNFIDETKEVNRTLGKLETAFKVAGHTSATANKTFEDLVGILGETDQAVEASNHLAKLTKNEKALAEWTDIATGVYATFGDSLPIENLTEAANETAKTGALTGGLADALNWAGVNEEKFQEKLDACNTESEREALIRSTLNGLYTEASESYRENNKELIESQEATAKLEGKMAELGEQLTPLKTKFQELGLALFEEFSPALQGAIDKVVGWFNKIDWGLVAKQLGTIWDNLSKFAGDVWKTLADDLSGIGGIITDIWNALSGDVNTENMDDVNSTLVKVKPVFKWLADNGETTAKAIEAIGVAFATWKTINLGLELSKQIATLKKLGFSKWLVTKVFKLSATKGIGAEILGALTGGAGAVVGALTIPIVLSFTADWWATDDQKEGWANKVDSRMGIDDDNLNKDKKTYKRNSFDWDETVSSFKTSMGDLEKWLDSSKVVSKLKEFLFPSLKDNKGNKVKLTDEIKDAWGGTKKWWGEHMTPFFDGVKESSKTLLPDIKKNLKKTWDDMVSQVWNPIVKFFDNFWVNVANKMTGGKQVFGKSFVDVIDDAIIKLNIKLNQLIGGMNEFFEKLGISTRIGSVTIGLAKKKYTQKRRGGEQEVHAWAKGTDNAPAGLSLVGEAGRELVADPKLGMFMADSATLVNLSKGATVLSNKNTEKMLKSFGIRAYAKGKNEGGFWSNVWDYASDPSKVVENLFKGLGISGGSKMHTAINELFKNGIKNGVLEYIKKVLSSDEVLTSPNHPDNKFAGTGAGFATAMTWARQALQIAGYIPSMQAYKDFMTAFKIVGRYESNYNNKSINLWDSNAKKGTPSAGWLQFIQPTFKANAFKGYTNWGNGLHQALAFINYANRRYGGPLGVPGVKSILRGGKYKPYANGGLITNPTMALMGEAGTEAVVPLSNAKALKPFGQAVMNAVKEEGAVSTGGSYEFTIPLYIDGREVARATAKFTQDELTKLEKRSNRLNGQR